MAPRLLRGARRRPRGVRRGDQEGLPQAGAREPPRPQPGRRRRPRSDSRRSRRPTTRSRTPRSASSTTPAGCSPASAAAAGGAAGGGFAPISATSSRPCFAAAAARPSRRPRARPRDRGHPRLQPGDGRRRDHGHRAEAVDLQDVQRHRGEPGTMPVICPRCDGRGIDSESQGFFSISQPCPQCGGARPDHRGALPDMLGLRPHDAAQALSRPDPGRGPRRQPHPRRRQGRGRRARRAAGRPLRGHPGDALAGLPPARRRQPRGDGPDHDRRGDPGRRRSRCRR